MNRIKRAVKKGIAFIVSLIIVITIVLPVIPIIEVDAVTRVYDAETAKGYAGNMFKTYINGGQDDLKIQDITENEFRAFGVLLSNFYVPLYSAGNKVDTTLKLKDLGCNIKYKDGGVVEEYNAWEEFIKVWNKDGSYDNGLMHDLLNKYKACFTSTCMKPLYNVEFIDTKEEDAQRAYAAGLLDGRVIAAGLRYEVNEDGTGYHNFDIPPLFVWYDDSGKSHIVYSFSGGTNSTGEAIAAFITTFESNIQNGRYAGHLDKFTSKNSVYKDTGELYVSPFGDICAIDGERTGEYTIIIPACLNPYSFQGNGEHGEAFNKLYINNMYMLSNFIDKTKMYDTKNDKNNKVRDWITGEGEIDLGGIKGTDNESENLYNFEKEIGNWGSDKNPRLGEVMHADFNSLITYQNIAYNTATDLRVKAGLAVDGFDPFVDLKVVSNIDDDKYTPTNVYLSAIQPLWAAYFVTQASGNCGIAMVSRSSLLDFSLNTLDVTEVKNGDSNDTGKSNGNYDGSKIIKIRANLYLKRQFPWTWTAADDNILTAGIDWVTVRLNAGADGGEKAQDGFVLQYSGKDSNGNSNVKNARGYVCALNPDVLGLDTRKQEYNWANIKADSDGKNGVVKKINNAIKNYFWGGSNAVSNACDATESSIKNGKDTETKYLIISLMDRVKKMDTQTVDIFKGISGIEHNNYNFPRISYTTCFYQINMSNVVSKIGLFGQFTGDNGDITSVKSINILDDGAGTVLKKTGLDKETVCKLNTTCGESSQSWSGNENNITSVVLPEFLYTLDAEFSNSKTWIFGETSGPSLSLNRNLMTNIYWAYIEDIVGVTADAVGDGSRNEKLEAKVEDRSFPHLPPIGSADDFKNNIFSNYDDDSDWESKDAEEAREKQNDDIRDKIHKLLNIGETIGKGLKDANNYVINWLKAMVDSLFIGWHNHMVGVDTTAGITGTVSNIGNATKSGVYSTAMGYMTTPTFNNLPITGWIIANFTFVYVVLMLFIVVILLMLVITRVRRLPQAILIFISMAFLIILPVNMSNGAISISNGVAESTYADKFQYWAVMQHAEYIINQGNAKSDNQAVLLDNLDRSSESNKLGGVTLKWMAPKKWGIAEQMQSSDKNTKGLRLFLYLAGDVLDQEDYSNYQAGDTYIYRPYLAIFTEAHSLHSRQQSSVHKDNAKVVDKGEENALYRISQFITNEWNNKADSYGALLVYNKNKKGYDKLGSLNLEKGGEYKTLNGVSNGFFRFMNYRGDSILRSAVGGVGVGVNGLVAYPGAYYDSYYGNAEIITDKNNMYTNNERIYDMYLDTQLMKALFTFDVNDVLWEKSDSTYTTKCGLWLTNNKNANTRVSGEDLNETYYSTGVQSFFDYSESPYYYFYNVFSDMLIHTDNGSKISGSEDFLALLLSDETFKVTNQMSPAYGEFKDYLDMEGLFKFVIPLLDYGNGNATEYFHKYGSTVERSDFVDDTAIIADTTSKVESSVVSEVSTEASTDVSTDVSTEASTEASTENSDTVKTMQKDPQTKAEDAYNKHKQQLQAVYNMYSPWVDQLLGANSKTERIKSGYGWVDLMNPCDPADYQYFGRPMAFSKAEAVIRGYKDYDLSTVEIKIQNVLKDSYYDIINLINYKDLTSIKPIDAESYAAKAGWTGNEILVSAAAMIATFHFNQEFSDNGFMSTDITLYPQSYELKNMNFDAYLRIIMGNSMGINQVSLMRSDANSMTVYEEFIHETSVWSALVLIIEDLLAVFIIPLLKIMLITVIFILALALAVSCIINRPENMVKIFLATYILPLFAMMAIFILHTIVISWFIGDGSSAGLIDTHSISVTTGDPTVTLLLMIVVDLITSILMWKLLKFATKSTVKYIRDIASGAAALGKGVFSGVMKAVADIVGVGSLAVGAASAVGGAAKTAVGGAFGVGKAISHKREAYQERKLDKERNKLLKEGNDSKSGKGTGGSKTGTGGSGVGTSKTTGATGTGNRHTDAMAKDISAIRQKLEKGFNPSDMKVSDSTANGTGNSKGEKKKINSSGNKNINPTSMSQQKYDEFVKRRAKANSDRAIADPDVERQQAKQLHAKKQKFDELRKSSGARFDKDKGKWVADNTTDADRLNRLQYEITRSRRAQSLTQGAQSKGPSSVQQYLQNRAEEKANPVKGVGSHGNRTGKHAGGGKRKKSKKAKKAKKG